MLPTTGGRAVARYRHRPLQGATDAGAHSRRDLEGQRLHPVQTERIFGAMYRDDSDGGPSPTRMYEAFKVALCHLRARLEGSGITIEIVGYRRGYRLVIGAAGRSQRLL